MALVTLNIFLIVRSEISFTKPNKKFETKNLFGFATEKSATLKINVKDKNIVLKSFDKI